MKAIMFKRFLLFIVIAGFYSDGTAQRVKTFTRADTLRGSITPERAWWNVLRYDITVKPDYTNKTITGKNVISYVLVKDNKTEMMQIDLKEPLVIDSIFLNNRDKLTFSREGNVWHVQVPHQMKNSRNAIEIFYSGKVHEAVRPPWDGGWTWTKDSLGRPWMTVTCQGLGASIWYPCKDHQSDEPDKGASLTMIVPDQLVAVPNRRLQFKKINNNGTTPFKWPSVSQTRT